MLHILNVNFLNHKNTRFPACVLNAGHTKNMDATAAALPHMLHRPGMRQGGDVKKVVQQPSLVFPSSTVELYAILMGLLTSISFNNLSLTFPLLHIQ